MNLNSMKLICSVIFSISILVTVSDVQAKKMGGGSSIGRQSNTVTKNQNALPPKPVAPPVNAATPKPTTPAPNAPQAPAPSRFGGMGGILGGIAAGIGLSYLFSHMGMGAEMGSMFSNILMIGLVAILGIWLFRKFANRNSGAPALSTGIPGMNFPSAAPSENTWASNQPATSQMQSRGATGSGQVISNSNQLPLIEQTNNTNATGIHAHLTPGAFADKEVFLENAKQLFLQLQEASDQQNIDVLKEFTSPELFAILRQDMLGRQTAISTTQVLTLAADLLAVEDENQEYLASVRFSGTMREEVNGPLSDFSEVWNWSKPTNDSTGWILCGIQQIN
jgi:predicted lipid-binding transport protein (Tim44 family)